eukprot:TRINITY_DN18517_c0_g1_i2.p1 TRINITY_DN18517_c0_g1~~TRINITY_DN18517_c0_g1_i2.p1  ORF type:complete len:350 (-),score=77.48 TRINITY_DN18517_c0_g1_i2:91-1140(-)
MICSMCYIFFFFQAEDGIRDAQESRGLGDVYKRQYQRRVRGHRSTMPQKHSKNANSSMKFSRGDWNSASKGGYGSQFGSWHDGWQGTLEQRLGRDAHMPFGYCALSLQPCVDPMASPSGHLYSREIIYEYLLSKKKEIQRQTKQYEDQQAEVASQAADVADMARENDLQDFIDSQEGVVDKSAAGGKRPDTEALAKEMIGGKRDGANQELTEKRKEFLSSNFWVPTMVPDNIKAAIAKPDKRPRSPMSGDPLKLKDLIPLNLEEDPETDTKTFVCAVTKKELKHQPVVCIKSTGQVMLKKVYEECAKPEMKCPVTGKTFKEGDVITLQSGGTGFSAHNECTAKRYRPSM